MMMSGKGKISAAKLMACMDAIIATGGVPVFNEVNDLDDLVRQDNNNKFAAEAMRKAQDKRDRKAAKRIVK